MTKLRARNVVLISAAILLLGAAAVMVLVKMSNGIIKHALESLYGDYVSVERVDLRWGHVDAYNIRLKQPGGRDIARAEALSIKADFTGLLRGQYIISHVSIKNPHVLIERDNKGNIVKPALPAQPTKKTGEKKSGTGAFTVNKIEITGGSLDYVDRKVPGEPVSVKFRDIKLEARNVVFPLADNVTTFNVKASVPGRGGNGILKSTGKVNAKTLDLESTIEAQQVDIVPFEPYFRNKIPVKVVRGFLDLRMDGKILSNRIDAPGEAVIRNLDLSAKSGADNKFIGIPAPVLISFLKNNKDEISLKFALKGNLDEPNFVLRENLVEKIAPGIARSIADGSFKDAGESVVEGIRKIRDNLKKGLFK